MFAEIGGNTGFARSGTVPAMARSRKSPQPKKRKSPNRVSEGETPKVTKRRGRPPTTTEPPLYPKNLILRELRIKADYPSQREFAEAAGISTSYYGEIERGDARINDDTWEKIRGVLHISGLLEVAINATVPVRFVVSAEASTIRREETDLGTGEHNKMAPANEALQKIAGCFAVEIGDDSADLDYPREATLYLRPVVPGEALPIRCPIIARFYEQPRTADGKTRELLYGLLDRTAVGDIVLLTRSATLSLPSGKLIQSGSDRLRAVNPRLVDAIPKPQEIEYTARADDPAEIIGVVVYALTPVLGGSVSRETR